MVLYQCVSEPATLGTGVYECSSMPLNCFDFTFVWVPGSGAVVMPPEAGFAVGPGGMIWATLQVHYNNLLGLFVSRLKG